MKIRILETMMLEGPRKYSVAATQKYSKTLKKLFHLAPNTKVGARGNFGQTN